MSEIAAFYAHRTVLITGGTGFMGKVMVEKLLRSCPQVERIYLLVRGKGAHSAQERLNAMLESELFYEARRCAPDFAQKVVAMNGELTAERMGLSDADYDVIVNKVSVVFHVAATVKFTERIKNAVEVNVLVVKRILELGSQIKHLMALIHVSTAYAHTDKEVIEEVAYPPVMDPHKLINLMNTLDNHMADSIAADLVGKRPNTYTFTKSIAEALVASYASRLPVAIVRPSIIGSTWKAPVPGWVDNFNGPAGVCLAAGTGLMRVMPGKVDVLADIVPVDTVGNFTLAVPWFIATKTPEAKETRTVRVFNMTSGSVNSCKWEVWVRRIVETYQKYPLESRTFRRPHFYFADKDSWYYWFRRQIFHMFPAHTADTLLRLTGQAPKMIKNMEKLDRASAELQFFTSNGWKWANKNGLAMAAAMNEVDKKEFDVDMSTLHWPSYVESMCVGVKKYILKEDMSRVHIARRSQWRMMLCNSVCKALLMMLLVRLLLPFLRRRGLLRSSWLLLLPTLVRG